MIVNHAIVSTGVGVGDVVKYFDPQTATFNASNFASFQTIWEVGGIHSKE